MVNRLDLHKTIFNQIKSFMDIKAYVDITYQISVPDLNTVTIILYNYWTSICNTEKHALREKNKSPIPDLKELPALKQGSTCRFMVQSGVVAARHRGDHVQE